MTINLLHVNSINSTQKFLELNSGLVNFAVLANHQSCGYGQHGNRWYSELNTGLLMSAALPIKNTQSIPLMTRAACAAAEFFCLMDIPLGLKWPNDFVVIKDGRLFKIGGIIGTLQKHRIILGIGINIFSAPAIFDRVIQPISLIDIYPNQTKLLPTVKDIALKILTLWSDLTIDYSPSFYWPQYKDLVKWHNGEGMCLEWLKDGSLLVQTNIGLQKLFTGATSLEPNP